MMNPSACGRYVWDTVRNDMIRAWARYCTDSPEDVIVAEFRAWWGTARPADRAEYLNGMRADLLAIGYTGPVIAPIQVPT